MPKCTVVRDSEGLFYGIRFWCPGCVYMDGSPMAETLPVSDWREVPGEPESPHQQGKPHWSFNGDLDKPVFGPSINTWWGGDHYKNEQGKDYIPVPLHRCHSFIGCNGAQPGEITFLADSTHSLSGKTVELPDAP